MNARSQFVRRTLVAAISACFAGNVFPAPQAPTVAAGQAGFQQSGNTLTITNTPGTIINWQSFSINRDEVVRFMQQSASSQVLNRVTGIDPSVILGQLQSNGRVLLINPNGVLFGKGAQVDVAGLLVSTLQLKDADFLAGRYKFNDMPGAGGIDNQGTIRTQSGGHVILIAPKVENSGLIQSPEGHILLAAGRSVTLADPDKPAIQVEVSNRDNTAVNLGSLIAKNVSIYGGIIKNSGLIQANTAVVGENGKIRLQAKYEVENTGTLQASGTQGGDILIQAAEGVARVQGAVEAKGSLPTVNPANAQKTENAGKGGRIEILAPEIVVDGVVDASGTTGGGAVFIGGQYQGGNNPVPTDWSANPALQRVSLSLDNPYATSPSVTALTTGSGDGTPTSSTSDQNSPLIPNRKLPTARTTTIGANARIRADGVEDGDGGIIVAWSDDNTTVHGKLSARGGANGGNGGLIETSGHHVSLSGIRIDAAAPAGKAGKWLIDPVDFTIAATDGDITGAELSAQLNNADVEILSSAGAVGLNGDINVNDAVSWNANRLTLSAYRDININAVMTATGVASLALNHPSNGGVRVGFDASGNFRGRVDFDRTGSGFLSINGNDYRVIGSLVALQDINADLTGNYALGAHIDASATSGWNGGQGFVPLGSGAAFSGNLDGLGHVVDGLAINRPGEDRVGLFNTIAADQRVSNLALTNVNITGHDYVGGLVGRNLGTVANSHVTGAVSGRLYVGGLAGMNDIGSGAAGFVDYSHAVATVTGDNAVGGLVGYNAVGPISSGWIYNSYATGDTVANSGDAGGLVGYNEGAVGSSYSGGHVNGYARVGGLVGWNDGTIDSAYSSADAVANTVYGEVGGLVGRNQGPLTFSFSTGSARGLIAGGLVGRNSQSIAETYSTASVTILGGGEGGGLVGRNEWNIDSSYSAGSVNTPFNGSAKLGGLVGYNSGAISNSASYASVTGGGSAEIGGLVANNSGAVTNSVWDTSKVASGIGANSLNSTGATGVGPEQRTLRTGYSVDFTNNFDIQPGETPTLLAFMPNNQFLGQIDGNWQNGRNWSLGHTPLSSERVTINWAHDPLISLSYGNSTVKRLDVQAALVVSGSSTRLTVTGDTNINGGEAFGSVEVNTGAVMTINGAALLSSNAPIEVSSGGRVDLGEGASLNISGNDYVLVRNADQLQAINNAGYYAIAVNIDANATSGWNSGAGFEPLGSTNSFSGVFEGFGHQISNLTIKRPTLDGVGLFGQVSDGTIRNIGVVNASIVGKDNVGAVVGDLQLGRVDNAYASGSVTGQNAVGGLVGASASFGNSSVTNSYSTATVLGNDSVGGLVGANWAYPGDGIEGRIENSYSTGNVTATGGATGGLVGLNAGQIVNSFYDIDTVLINGSHLVTEAGIYGGQFTTWLANNRTLSIWDYLTEDAGGFQIGTLQNLKDSLAFVGSFNGFHLTANLDLGAAPGLYIPALVGSWFDGNGYVVSNLLLNRPNSDNLGFIGELRNGAYVVNLGVENVSVVGRNRVGGVVGFSNGGSVGRSYSTGSVSGVDSVGGLVGDHFDGAIDNTYSSATVVASGNGGGGLVGRNRGWIGYSYSNGSVSGSGTLGGLVGTGNINISYGYWDVERSGQSSSSGGVGLTTDQARQQSSFSGFDFANIWEIDQGVSAPKQTIFAAPTNTWWGSTDYLWSTATNWSLGHVPLSTERVDIPWLYSDSVVFDLATGTVKRLTSDANFRIAGGSFNVNGNVTFNNGLSLDANSTLTVNGALTLNAAAAIEKGGKINLGPLASLSIAGDAYTLIRDLNELGGNWFNTRYALAGDIDASATSGWGAGTGLTPNARYADFDGLGHSISNLYINRPSQENVGLFNENYAEIRNVHLVNGTVNGADAVGGLVGSNFGTVSNSSFAGAVAGTGNNVGGLVGRNMGGAVINASSAAGTVFGEYDVGGLVGVNYGGILQSVSTATVNAIGTIGGLVGYNENSGVITRSYSSGAVAGDDTVGGLVGNNGGLITDSHALALSVQGNYYVGGLIGYTWGTTTNSYYDIDTTLINSVTAVTRYGIYGGQFQNWLANGLSLDIANYLTPDANGYYQIGSLQNLKDWLAFAELPGAKFRLTADLDLATLSGWNLPVFSGAEIDGAGHTLSHLNVNQPYNSNIGFVGNLAAGSSLHDIGIVNASIQGDWEVGGLVGYSQGDVSRAYVTGAASSIQGTGDVGGLIGWNDGGLSNSHYNIDQVLINGSRPVVTEGGIYDSQFADWLAGGLMLNAANYLTTDANGYYQLGSVQNLKDMLGFVDQAGSKFRLTSDMDLSTLPGWFIPVFRGAEIDGAGHVLSNLSVSQAFNPNLGFVGHLLAGGVIRNLGVEGASVAGYGSVGALVGWNEGSIEVTYSTGYVTGGNAMTGGNALGGLVGNNQGSISNSFSSATVDGAIQDAYGVGGLVGSNMGTITNSYASGVVSGASAIGGLIGYNSGAVTAAAWNTDTSGQALGIGQDYGSSSLVGMTSAQMADSANFASWDFSGVWAVIDGVPRLQGVGQSLTNIWTGLADGHDWFASGNWSLGHAPTASELVSIPDVAATTQIDINNGTGFSVRSVTSAEFLTVAGAATSFLLNGDSVLSAGLRIGSGATLTANGNLVIAGSGLNLAGGTLTAEGVTSVTNYVQSGGTLNGTGTLTAANAFNWTGGTMSGTGTTVVASGATGTLNGPANITQLYRTLDIRGTLDYAATANNGSLQIYNGGHLKISSGGVLNLTTDGYLSYTYGSTGGLITNSGMIRKTGGTGSLKLGDASLASVHNEDGTFEVLSGQIDAYQFNNTGNGFITAGTVNVAGGTGTVAGTLTGAGTLKLTGGTLTVDGTASISNYTQSGGTLTGSGALTATNAFNWTGGTMSGAGTTVVAAGATGTLNGPANITQLYRTLDIRGTLDYAATANNGSLQIYNGGHLKISSGGVLNLTTDGYLSYTYGSTGGLITNSGMIRKTGGTGSLKLGDATRASVHNEGGTFEVQSGQIDAYQFNNTGDSFITAGKVNVAGGTGTIAGTLTGAGTLSVSGGTLTVDGTASIANYVQSGGTLNGLGTLAATNTFNWTGGTMSGTGTTVVAAGATGTLNGPANITQLYRTLDIRGTLDYAATANNGSLQIYNGGHLKISSGGVLNLTTDGYLSYTYGSVGGLITNSGTIKKTGGSGSLRLGDTSLASVHNEGGTFEVLSGQIDAYQFNNTGNGFITAGTVNVAGGAGVVSGALDIASGAMLKMSSGTLSLADGAALNGNGVFSWTGGALNVTGSGSGASIGAGMTLNMTGRTIGGNGKLANYGTVVMGNSTLNANFANLGQLTVASGANTIAGSGAFDIDAGTIALSSGATLNKNGGAVNWHGGTLGGAGSLLLTGGASFNVNGSGARVLNGPSLSVASFDVVGGSLDVQNGTLSLAGGTLGAGSTMTLNGGSVSNSATLTVAGTLDLAGGALGGAGALNVTGSLRKSSAGTQTLLKAVNNSGLVQVANGTLNLAGGGAHGGTFQADAGTVLSFSGGSHTFGNGSQLTGAGDFLGGGALTLTGNLDGLTVDAGTSINLNALALGGSGNLTNHGSMSGSGVALGGSLVNTGYAALSGGSINGGLSNTGTLDVGGNLTIGGSSATLAAGSINLGNGATLTKDGGMLYWSGGTFGGSGTLAYVNGGTFAFAGNGDRVIDNPNLTFAFSDLTLPNGSLTLNNGGLTFNGNTTMPAGTALNMYGGTITNNGPLNISGLFGLYGGTLAGAGAINMTGGTIDLPANSTVNWTATGTMSNSGTLNLSNRTITNAITNNGTINTTGGLIFTQLFTNQGTLNLNSGTTTFSAGILQNSGSTKLGTGGGASANVIAGGSGFNLAGGGLSGSGNIAGDLTVGAASLSVGFSPGSLTINGNLNLSGSSTTSIELGGTAPGSGYDTIAVTGTANLGGALNVTSYGGYTPAAGSSHDFMSFSSSTGSFLSTNLPAGWAMSLTSTSSYLSLLMAAQVIAQTTGVSPLQALMQALAAASGQAGGTASDPGAMTMGGTTLDFSRVTPNDLATSLTQQLLSVTQVLPTNDFEDLKVCQ